MSKHTADISRVREVRERHAGQLMAIPGVVGVGVGMSQKGGRFTDDVAIVVTVRRKRAPQDVPPAERIPDELEGVPVDVQEAGDIQAG